MDDADVGRDRTESAVTDVSSLGTPDDEERGNVTLNIHSATHRHSADEARLTVRHFFSSHLLWTARRESKLAGKIEAAHAGRSRFSIEHRGHVLSSIVASAAFLEAMINELYQDAADERASPDARLSPDGVITPLSEDCRSRMAELWRETDEGWMPAIEKYEKLLDFAGARPLDRGGQVYEDARLVIRLRDRILHYRPEDLSVADEAHPMERSLRRRKFPNNALWEGAADSWWPNHALGHGAAMWAHRAVRTLADHVSDALGIEPNYRRVERDGWFGSPPGE